MEIENVFLFFLPLAFFCAFLLLHFLRFIFILFRGFGNTGYKNKRYSAFFVVRQKNSTNFSEAGALFLYILLDKPFAAAYNDSKGKTLPISGDGARLLL